MSKTRNWFALLLLPLLVAVGVLCLRTPKTMAGEEVGYWYLRSLPSIPTAHKLLTSGDATTWGVPLNPVATVGNPQVAVKCDMSVASATCVVSCGLYYQLQAADAGYVAGITSYVYLGQARLISASATATAAGSGVTDNGWLGTGNFYPALANCVFDTTGASYYDVRLATPSSGNVSAAQWCYGVRSQ
jgi:hypothetical protein